MYWRLHISNIVANEAQTGELYYLWSVALNGRVGELHLIDVTILEEHGKHALPMVGYVRVRVSICRIYLITPLDRPSKSGKAGSEKVKFESKHAYMPSRSPFL